MEAGRSWQLESQFLCALQAPCSPLHHQTSHQEPTCPALPLLLVQAQLESELSDLRSACARLQSDLAAEREHSAAEVAGVVSELGAQVGMEQSVRHRARSA